MELKLDEIVSHLRKVREEHGDDGNRRAVEAFARNVVATDAGLGFMQQVASQLQDEDLDLERLQQEALAQQQMREEAVKQARASIPKGEGLDANDVFIKALQQQMPAVKTQAHFDLVQTAFQALQLCINSYLEGDHNTAEKARMGLNQTLDLAEKVKDIDEKLADNPEATTDESFIRAPREFEMHGNVQQFLSDLESMESIERLNQWYQVNKASFDRVTDQKLRNQLFDKIRQTKKALLN